jgi:hypothetical protein
MQLPDEYWVSRGRTEGVLLDTYEVWAVCPERHRSDDGDVMWLAPLGVVDRFDTFVGEFKEDEMRAHVRTLPDDDLQLIHVGGV